MSRHATLGLLLAGARRIGGRARRARSCRRRIHSRLDVLYTAAQQHDPRTRELALRESQTALHLRTIANERLPAVARSAQEQYQSVVTEFPGSLGRPGQSLLHDTYDANVQVTQTLFDPSRGARAAVERAQLARNRADVLTALYTTRQQVNAAFFPVAALHGATRGDAGDDRRSRGAGAVAEARVRNGAALTSELSTVRAELLRRRQDDEQLLADRDAATAGAVRSHRRRVPQRRTDRPAGTRAARRRVAREPTPCARVRSSSGSPARARCSLASRRCSRRSSSRASRRSCAAARAGRGSTS